MTDRPEPARSRLALGAIVALALCRCLYAGVVSRAARARRGSGKDRPLSRHLGRSAHLRAHHRGRALRAGWAQAEDRPEQLLLDLMMGLGEFASVVGEPGVEVDLRSRMWDHYGVAKSRLAGAPPRGARAGRGVRRRHQRLLRRASRRRARVVAAGAQVDPYMVVAFGRLFVYNWSIDEAYGDLKPRRDRARLQARAARLEPVRDRAAALAPRRRRSWPSIRICRGTGPARFLEFRIHAGALEGSGTSLAGAPYLGQRPHPEPGLGDDHRRPDTADVYELTLDPADPSATATTASGATLTRAR